MSYTSQASSRSGSKNIFTAASVQVITQDSASQTCSVPDSPVILAQYPFDVDSGSSRQGACSLFLYPATSSLLGRMADTNTHRAPANTRAYRLNVCNRQNAHTPTQQMPFLSALSSRPPLLLSYNPTNLSWGHLEGPRRITMFSSVPTF